MESILVCIIYTLTQYSVNTFSNLFIVNIHLFLEQELVKHLLYTRFGSEYFGYNIKQNQ